MSDRLGSFEASLASVLEAVRVTEVVRNLCVLINGERKTNQDYWIDLEELTRISVCGMCGLSWEDWWTVPSGLERRSDVAVDQGRIFHKNCTI